MQDKLMENVQVILELYKKGELDKDQTFDILYGMYRTASIESNDNSKDFTKSYFNPVNVSTTWNESFSSEQE